MVKKALRLSIIILLSVTTINSYNIFILASLINYINLSSSLSLTINVDSMNGKYRVRKVAWCTLIKISMAYKQ